MDLRQIIDKDGSIDKSHPKILFHKILRATGSNQFYFKSLLDGAQRIVGFDEKGKPMNTTDVTPRQLASLFKKRWVNISS